MNWEFKAELTGKVGSGTGGMHFISKFKISFRSSEGSSAGERCRTPVVVYAGNLSAKYIRIVKFKDCEISKG